MHGEIQESSGDELCTVAEVLGMVDTTGAQRTGTRVYGKRARNNTLHDMPLPLSSSLWTESQSETVSHSVADKRTRRLSSMSATPRLTQTFLDFGQFALHQGHTCPRCGMLYTALDEDAAVHRQFCDGVHRAVRRGSVDAWQRILLTQDTNTVDIRDAFVQSSAAVRVFEKLLRKMWRRPNELHSEGMVSCDKIQDGRHTLDALSLYVLRCGAWRQSEHLSGALTSTQRQMWLWLQLFDLVRADEALMNEAVVQSCHRDATNEAVVAVVAVQERLRRVVCGVTGCARRREHHDVEATHAKSFGEGCDACRGVCTLCDVRAIWLPPGSSYTNLSSSKKVDSTGEVTQQPLSQRAAVLDTLRLTLRTLGKHVLYGQHLDPVTQFSYSSTLFGKLGALARCCVNTSPVCFLNSAIVAEDKTVDRDADECHPIFIVHDTLYK